MIRRQPTALPPAQKPLELPPPAVTQPAPTTPTDRTAPGTWREIIARFEAQTAETAAARSEEAGAADAPGIPREGTEGQIEPIPAEPPAVVDDAAPSGPPEMSEPAEAEPPIPDDSTRGLADDGLAWEIGAMTTADYTTPRSIHDPEHDSWPVDAKDGDAVPAWSDAVEQEDEEDAGSDAGEEVRSDAVDEYDDIGELVLDDVVAGNQWEDELEPSGGPARRPVDFPLDAFIVPAGVHHAPAGYDEEHVALLVAHRLDELARQLRDGGLGALGHAGSVDELSRVLAAIVTGYVARDG